MTKNDRKVLGCLLGCCALIAVAVLAVVGVGYYTLKFGAYKPAARVDTAAAAGGQPVVLCRVDLQAPTAFSLAMLDDPTMRGYNGAFLKMFLPYEGTFALDSAPDSPVAEVHALLSMPRMAEFIVRKLGEARPMLETNGRRINTLELQGEDKGLAVLRGTLPLPTSAQDLRADGWPQPRGGGAPALERSHFVELTLDNRNGLAGVAISALAQTLGVEEDTAPYSPAPLVAPDPTAPQEPLSLLGQVRIIKGLKFITTAWLAADFTDKGDAEIQLRVSAADEVSAMFLMAGLGPLPEILGRDLAELGIHVKGDITREAAEIHGKIVFAGVTEAVRRSMNNYSERSNSGEPPAWLMKNLNLPPAPAERL